MRRDDETLGSVLAAARLRAKAEAGQIEANPWGPQGSSGGDENASSRALQRAAARPRNVRASPGKGKERVLVPAEVSQGSTWLGPQGSLKKVTHYYLKK